MYSRDGKLIFVGDNSGSIKCYDATSGKIRWQNKQRHKQLVLGMGESSDGQLLATSGRDGTIGIWDVNTGRLVTSLDDMGDPRQVVWSPDMKKLTICGFGGRADVYRWKGNVLEYESTSAQSNSQIMVFAPDGLMFASGVQGESIELRDGEQGRTIRQFYGHRGQVRAICFDRYGRRMLTAGADGTCRLWDLTKIDGYVKRTMGSEGLVEAIDYHPTAQRFAVAIGVQRSKASARSGRPRIEVWDSIRHTLIAQFFGHTDWLTTVRFSRDGNKLVSGSRDKTVRIWDANKITELAVLEGHTDRIEMAAFWGNDKTVSVDSSGILKIWDNQTHQSIESWSVAQADNDDEPALTACSMHEETGLLVVAQRDAISFWDLSKKSKITSLPNVDRVKQLKFSWDGQLMGVASSNPEISVFDVSGLMKLGKLPEPKRLRGHIRQVTSLSFSPDNKRLAAAGLDEPLCVFEFSLGHEVLKMDDNVGVNNRVAFSPDGRQLTTCEGRIIYTYSLDRLDHKSGQSPEEAITTWHIEDYHNSAGRLNAHAAAFHARALVERQPELPIRRFWLASSLTDLGKYDDSLKVLQQATPRNQEDHFNNLGLLIRVHLQAKNRDAYRDCCREYQQLVAQSASNSDWNNFAWFVALGNLHEIDLSESKNKLEEFIKAAEDELRWLTQLDLQLKKDPQDLSDDDLIKLEIKRTDIALAPSSVAKKKWLTQRSLGFFSNTIALVYYRLGDYPKAYRSSKRSIELEPVSQPLDHMIQAMALCQLKRQSANPEQLSPPLDEEFTKLLRECNANVLSLVAKVDQWYERTRRREFSVAKNNVLESHMQQLEFPLLFSELQLQLAEADIRPASKVTMLRH